MQFVRPSAAEWENMYYKRVELHKAVKLWSMRGAMASGGAYCDRSSERQLDRRTSVGQAPWEAHSALEEAGRRTEDAAGGSENASDHFATSERGRALSRVYV